VEGLVAVMMEAAGEGGRAVTDRFRVPGPVDVDVMTASVDAPGSPMKVMVRRLVPGRDAGRCQRYSYIKQLHVLDGPSIGFVTGY